MYFRISNLEMPSGAAYVVQSNREDGLETKDYFRAWTQACRCHSELVLHTLCLRLARDYVSGSGRRPKGSLKEWGGTMARGRGETFFVTDNPAAQVVRA